MTFEQWRKQFRFPKHIIGADGKPILFEDAKLADLRAYQRLLEERIAGRMQEAERG